MKELCKEKPPDMKPGGPKRAKGVSLHTAFLPEAGRVDVESAVPHPGVYTKEELRTLHDRIVSNLEQAWEITGGSEDQLTGVLVQISQGVAKGFKAED